MDRDSSPLEVRCIITDPIRVLSHINGWCMLSVTASHTLFNFTLPEQIKFITLRNSSLIKLYGAIIRTVISIKIGFIVTVKGKPVSTWLGFHLKSKAKTQTIEKSIYCFPDLTQDWDLCRTKCQESAGWTTHEANMCAQLMLIVIDAINKLEKKPFNCSNIPWFIAHCNLLVRFIDPLCFHHFITFYTHYKDTRLQLSLYLFKNKRW